MDSLIRALLGLELGAGGQDAGNRFVVDGLTLARKDDGSVQVGVRRFEAASIRLVSGPFVLELGRLAVHELVGLLRIDANGARLSSLQAADAELSGVKVHGPLSNPTPARAAGGKWRLAPLAGAEGVMRARITDAHLLFDADVTVPIRQGQVHFNQASVEHVGPDSRMGVSRMGLYVDAPNGRSYLYQFASAPVAGVEYEKRGAMLGPWVSDRGSLRLDAFLESLLGQPPGTSGPGVTDQARLLLDRTAASGELQLGDGTFAAPGVQADLAGRAEGRNAIRVHADAVGRGLSAEIAALSVRNVVLNAPGAQLRCNEVTGKLVLRLSVEAAQLRFALESETIKVTGLGWAA